MDARELMIGDWIRYGSRFGIVKGIKTDTCLILVSCNGNDELIWETFDNIESIPLTPEILESNGFFKLGNQYNTWCMRNFNFSLDFIDGILGYYEQNRPYNPTFVTKYVHELQHALRLCRIDKTIEL